METVTDNKKDLLTRISGSGIWIVIGLIKIYQKTLSPDHGVLHVFFRHGICRYTPSCSQYMIDALRIYGWKGLYVGVKRVGRCHPFAVGGYDPVPKPRPRG